MDQLKEPVSRAKDATKCSVHLEQNRRKPPYIIWILSLELQKQYMGKSASETVAQVKFDSVLVLESYYDSPFRVQSLTDTQSEHFRCQECH